jgi:signal transduction histidine kinase
VQNTGPGIPAADLPQVFERFYRTDTSRSRKTGGVGLGLAICKAICDAHGAELTVESTSGRTCFTLRMPS